MLLVGLLLGAALGGMGTYLLVERSRHADSASDATAFNQLPNDAAAPEVTILAKCTVERRAIETAFEAFFADNGHDAASLSDLLPGYLKADPSARWAFTAGSPPTIRGIGVCLSG